MFTNLSVGLLYVKLLGT